MKESVELELRNDIKKMREDMNKGFKELSVQLAKVTTKQNVGAWVFRSFFTIAIATISGIFGAHFTK